MKKLIIILFCTVIAAVVRAGSYSPETLPRLDHTTRVSNPDHILTPAEVAQIDSVLMQLERSKGVQGLVIVVEHLDWNNPYKFAIGIGRKWGVGQENSMGFVKVLATLDRSYQLVTGDGLEKHFPDAVSKRIQNLIEVPLLKEGKWGEAVIQTVTAYKDYLEGDSELNNKLRTLEEEEEEDENRIIAFFVLIMGGGLLANVLLHFYSKRKKSKCPKCGQITLKQQGDPKLVSKSGRRRTYEIMLVCQNCGNIVVRHEIQEFSPSDPDDYIPMYMRYNNSHDSSSGGSSSSGGFSSFGGGSFSGGGSGGRF